MHASHDLQSLTPDTRRPLRTFIAVLISDELKRTIALVQGEFKKLAPKVKWVAEDNFHVTVKFLGDVGRDRLARISEALAEALEGVRPFNIEVAGVGAFPGAGRPRTVWVGITGGHEELAEVARRVDRALEKLGFPREDRPFKSHITIGRSKDDRDGMALSPALREAETGRLGSVRVDAVAVMKSDLRPGGPVYSKLSEIRLRDGDKETKADG